ncbi:unnamed protein product [Boreogadus saida]
MSVLRSRTGFYRQEVNRTCGTFPRARLWTGAQRTEGGHQEAPQTLPVQAVRQAALYREELRLLKHMKHENVIGLLDVFTSEIILDRFWDFYLVMPFMGTDLGKLMRLEKLTEERVQFLVYQMLKGLKAD